jgi:regulator of replication initiation timing
VVHNKANRSEQAVTRELSGVLYIVIVFVAKNNRLCGRNRKRRQKLEESKKNRQKKKESAEKTKEPAGKTIIIRLYPNKF